MCYTLLCCAIELFKNDKKKAGNFYKSGKERKVKKYIQ